MHVDLIHVLHAYLMFNIGYLYHTYMHMYACMYIYVYIYIMCVYVCVFSVFAFAIPFFSLIVRPPTVFFASGAVRCCESCRRFYLATAKHCIFRRDEVKNHG